MLSKRLSRQIKKAFGVETTEGLAAAEVDQIKSNFDGFLTSVDETYCQLQERAEMAQRNMQLSGDELTQANHRLFAMNQTFGAMVNSLGQGFVLIGKDGICQDIFSKACETLLEANPAGRPLSEILRITEDKMQTYRDWIDILFRDTMDFEDFSKLCPMNFQHSLGKVIDIEFKPVRNPANEIVSIILIATDLTREVEATQRAEKMQANALFVSSITRNKDRFSEFVAEFRKVLPELIESLQFGLSSEIVLQIKRRLHGYKGVAGTFGMLELKKGLHEIESGISKRETLTELAPYLNQELPRLLEIFEATLAESQELIGELTKHNEPHREIALSSLRSFADRMKNKQASDEMVRGFIESFVALPATVLFSRYNSILQQVARKLNKQVSEIKFEGSVPRLIPENFSGLWADLEHVFRNIVDHGIEPVEKRRQLHKPDQGQVTIEFSQTPENLEIKITDDGKGIDPAAIRAKLEEKGITAWAQKSSEATVIEAIFLPGFSTADEVSDISGRGIGMNALQSTVKSLGGQIKVKSQVDQGTTLSLIFKSSQMLKNEVGQL